MSIYTSNEMYVILILLAHSMQGLCVNNFPALFHPISSQDAQRKKS